MQLYQSISSLSICLEDCNVVDLNGSDIIEFGIGDLIDTPTIIPTPQIILTPQTVWLHIHPDANVMMPHDEYECGHMSVFERLQRGDIARIETIAGHGKTTNAPHYILPPYVEAPDGHNVYQQSHMGKDGSLYISIQITDDEGER